MRDLSFAHEPSEVAEGRQIIEPVIMHSYMRDVRGHVLAGAVATELQQRLVAGHVEGQDGAAVHEPLSPFRPSPSGVLAFDGEDRRAAGYIPGAVDIAHFASGQIEQSLKWFGQVRRFEFWVDAHENSVFDVSRAAGHESGNVVRASWRAVKRGAAAAIGCAVEPLWVPDGWRCGGGEPLHRAAACGI
jgi:hypothetical protein